MAAGGLRRQALRYAAVGVANTALGYAVILGLHAAGASVLVANLAGYGAGLALSFLGNRAWTFGARGSAGADLLRFLVLVGLAFLINLAVVRGLLAADLSFPAAQAAGVIAYSAFLFLGLRHVLSAAHR